MTDLHLLMPMGGNGSRFSKNGYSLPKPMIKIYGKPFFYWAVKSIMKFNNLKSLTFVVLKEHVLMNNIDAEIRKYFPEAKILILDHVLNGPVLTCLYGISYIDDDYPLLINDCDHLFKSTDFNEACKNGIIDTIDGGLITFKSNCPQYSYVKFENGKVVGTVEKKVVSSEAICGAYLFKNAAQFRMISDKYLKSCDYSEYYISGMYNELLKKDANVHIFSTDFHIPFGTPEEYELALQDKNYIELE